MNSLTLYLHHFHLPENKNIVHSSLMYLRRNLFSIQAMSAQINYQLALRIVP